MSKGLCNMSSVERKRAIVRRLKMSEAVRGLGYWAAVDAKERMEEEEKKNEK